MSKGDWVSFYEAVHRTSGKPLAVCLHCHTKYKHPWQYSSKPTVALSRHIKSCSQYKRYVRQGSQTSTISNYFNIKSAERVTKPVIEGQILKFFISANIPFRQADNEHFRRLISLIHINNQPVYPPSRKVLRARLSNEAEAAKADLKVILIANQSKISLALDCWSTRTHFSFIGMYLTPYL